MNLGHEFYIKCVIVLGFSRISIHKVGGHIIEKHYRRLVEYILCQVILLYKCIELGTSKEMLR